MSATPAEGMSTSSEATTLARASRRHRRQPVDIPVRVSRRARKLCIHVDALRNVEIVVPPRTSQDEIDSLLFRAPRVARAAAREAAEGVSSRPAARRRRVDRRPRAARSARSLARDWYREQARIEVARVVEREAKRLESHLHAPDDSRPADALGLLLEGRRAFVQLALILAPPAVLDLRRRARALPPRRHDHSPSSGSSSRAARPTYEEERDWLAEHGPELLAYRVPKRAPRA